MRGLDMWQTKATNRKGDFHIVMSKSGKAADVVHARLYSELDSKGFLKWGTICTTNVDRSNEISAPLNLNNVPAEHNWMEYV